MLRLEPPAFINILSCPHHVVLAFSAAILPQLKRKPGVRSSARAIKDGALSSHGDASV
jgi:hypothetical protein